MQRISFLLLLLFIPLLSVAQFSDKEETLLRDELAKRINNLRIEKGLSPLIFNEVLKEAAEFHSDYLSESKLLSHDQTKAKYATPKKRVQAFNGKDFDLVGENVLASKPRTFPLKKSDIIALAEEMYLLWKNSPGHYANMIHPEYIYGDLGFKEATDTKVVYATHVFGTKGSVVDNQLSTNSFGLEKAPADCEKEYAAFSNVMMNMGNNMEIEGNEVVLYYHDIEYFKLMFPDPNDGIAVDLISMSQLECGKPNQLDMSEVYDGILLKPTYRDEMFANNRAESDYRIITKVGTIPDELSEQAFSPAMIIIKNGKACKYLYPAFVPRQDYTLRPIEPIIKDEPAVTLLDGIVHSQTVHYDFKTNVTSAIKNPTIEKYKQNVHSITIHSYSSVEGDSVNNEKLHAARANYIKRHLSQTINVHDSLIHIDAKENWHLMNFQLNYFQRDDLANLPHDSIKALIASKDNSLPWDSLLFSQREATATIHYIGQFPDVAENQSQEEFNFRTAIATNNTRLANSALYSMYYSRDYDPAILFEPTVTDFFVANPSAVANYAALLSLEYEYDVYACASFLHHWLKRKNELSDDAKSNLLHLYTLVGSHLLDNWDVSAARLSNVIHPNKILEISPAKFQDELVLNLHLTFIHYFGQVNDGPNISKSFYFIAEYFQGRALKPEDDNALALYFNNWSMYDMTIKLLTQRFKEKKINEDGLFILAATMNFSHHEDVDGIYIDVHQQAVNQNESRWCEWLSNDYQVKRNSEIKAMFCRTCQ